MRTLLSLLALCLCAGPLHAQLTSGPLTVRRADGAERVLRADQLAKLPRVAGRASAHGKAFSYAGADVRDVLHAGGVAPVDSLHGPQLRQVVVFVGADGAVLPEARGPRRIIVEGDARPSRWVQQVVRLEVVDVP